MKKHTSDIVWGVLVGIGILAICYMTRISIKTTESGYTEAEEKELIQKSMDAGKNTYELILLKDNDFHYNFKKSDSLYKIEQTRIIKSLYN